MTSINKGPSDLVGNIVGNNNLDSITVQGLLAKTKTVVAISAEVLDELRHILDRIQQLIESRAGKVNPEDPRAKSMVGALKEIENLMTQVGAAIQGLDPKSALEAAKKAEQVAEAAARPTGLTL